MTNYLQFLIWVGSIAYGVASIPQIIFTIRKGEAKSVSWGLIFFFIVGSVSYVIYSIATNQIPMVGCNIGTFTGAVVMGFYKVFPRNTSLRPKFDVDDLIKGIKKNRTKLLS